VIDRQQAAAPGDLGDPGGGWTAEVDRADTAVRARMSGFGGDLLAGDHADAELPAERGEFAVVGDRVVIGDRQYVQPGRHGKRGEVSDRGRTVRVQGMRMQISGHPFQPRSCGQRSARWASRYGDSRGGFGVFR